VSARDDRLSRANLTVDLVSFTERLADDGSDVTSLLFDWSFGDPSPSAREWDAVSIRTVAGSAS
jgi:hypothetical protein